MSEPSTLEPMLSIVSRLTHNQCTSDDPSSMVADFTQLLSRTADTELNFKMATFYDEKTTNTLLAQMVLYHFRVPPVALWVRDQERLALDCVLQLISHPAVDVNRQIVTYPTSNTDTLTACIAEIFLTPKTYAGTLAMRALLSRVDYDVNTKLYNGYSLLHYTVIHGDAELMRLVLNHPTFTGAPTFEIMMATENAEMIMDIVHHPRFNVNMVATIHQAPSGDVWRPLDSVLDHCGAWDWDDLQTRAAYIRILQALLGRADLNLDCLRLISDSRQMGPEVAKELQKCDKFDMHSIDVHSIDIDWVGRMLFPFGNSTDL